MSTLEQILSKAFIDPNFRRHVATHPEKVASEYNLTAGDLAALRLLGVETWREDIVGADEPWPDEGIIRRFA